ncbi:MAG: hypothetical protein E7033_01900 [Akkermansiaceae bacterium]|nr:hypothetical protein [Akkermansiaceae bacterium]
MKKIVTMAMLAASALVFTSCGDPTFDASNEVESIKAIGESLDGDAEKAKEFGFAYAKLKLQGKVKEMDGKTADEIIEMAK